MDFSAHCRLAARAMLQMAIEVAPTESIGRSSGPGMVQAETSRSFFRDYMLTTRKRPDWLPENS